MRRNGLLFAAAVILIANAFVLVGVARNRSGHPQQTIQLTERELPMNYRGNEDTGISLRLQWGQRSFSRGGYPLLDQAKLESLGFDCKAALRDTKRQPLDRPAFLVLELNGSTWQSWLKSAEETKTVPDSVKMAQSKIFVVDAAKTPEPLLAKYTDRKMYLVTRGVVRLFVNTWDAKVQNPRLESSISELLPGTIHVPLPLSNMLANRSANTPALDFHYTVTLAYGSRFEPWVVKVE